MPDTKSLLGIIQADTIEARFAFSGQVSALLVHPGDEVKVGQILARIDTKILQAELDKELADYERTRADFEIYVKKAGEPADDFAKFEKIQKQASLNSSVKSVELAKFRLDQTSLVSPVRGIVVDVGGLRQGLYATPGANPIKILDLNSTIFSVTPSWSQLKEFQSHTGHILHLDDTGEQVTATILSFIPPQTAKDKPQLNFSFSSAHPVYPGMSGSVSLGDTVRP